MPCGAKHSGRQEGRPKKRKGKKSMNDNDYEMIGESIWNTYANMAYILAETEEGQGAGEQGRRPGQTGEGVRALAASRKGQKERLQGRRPPTKEELRAAGKGTEGTAYGHKRVK